MFEFLFGKKKKKQETEAEEFRKQQIENFDKGYAEAGDFSLPVEDVFMITGRGIVVTGKIEKGQISVGDTVTWTNSAGAVKGELTIKGVEMFRKVLTTAREGDNVGLLLEGVNDKSKIVRGDRLVK